MNKFTFKKIILCEATGGRAFRLVTLIQEKKGSLGKRETSKWMSRWGRQVSFRDTGKWNPK